MKQFRKKPVVIEAVQFTVTNWKEIEEWTGDIAHAGGNWKHYAAGEPYLTANDSPYLTVSTLEGKMTAVPGDWIIKGVKGEFYPCKPDIFEATYDPA